MGRKSKPKAGSLGVYPRVRASENIAKFKTYKKSKDLKILNFYGYKVGMLHVMATNKHKGSAFLNQRVSLPATLVEFPELTVFGVRMYHKVGLNVQTLGEFIFYDKAHKNISRRLNGSDRAKSKGDMLKNVQDFFEKNKSKLVDLRLVAHTNPQNTTVGSKTPDVVELAMSGDLEARLNFFKERLGKGISVDDAFKQGNFLDVRAVTKGHGFEGAIKRFGIKRRSHKAEKGPRKVGSISPWNPSTVMWTTPRPGQMGYHARTNYNLKVLKIAIPEEVQRKGGFEGYGVVRNKALIIYGSIPGPVKRLITFRDSVRPFSDIKQDVSDVESIVL